MVIITLLPKDADILELSLYFCRNDVIPDPCPLVEGKKVRGNLDQERYSRLSDKQKRDR